MTDNKPSLFLSYARADDEPFVRQLYERLIAEGFSVWWDRKCMPSRALTFLKEIRDAIRASDRVVVVIGPKCVTSDYCRAEWQAALAETRIVNPLIRIGEHELLPPELASLHCPDFRDDANFEDAFKEILRVLTEPIPPLGALLGGVPDVPPHFQPRPDASSRLAEQLLIDEKKPVIITGPQRVTVMHGMGGTGKSVLAATFARSTSTRRSFSDGIYWLNADEKAPPLAIAAQLGQLLGDPEYEHTSQSASASQLTRSLAGKGALIVLDNAWHVEQTEALVDALGPACRLLVTTRNLELVMATGANAVELGQLSPSAALAHLADWSGLAPNELPAEAQQVANECGLLPFALALNGAMHQKGVSWADLANALRSAEIDYAEQRFKGYPYPTVLKSIKVSMDVLDVEDAGAGARLRELAAFHSQRGIPEAAVRVLWSHTAGYEERHVGKTLAQLAAKALIRLQEDGRSRSVYVHDLQSDYLARVTDAKALNVALLDAYEQLCDGKWPNLPADGYIHQHLINHLLIAGRTTRVHALLDESSEDGGNAWYQANEAIDNVTAYLADLERVQSQCADQARALRLTLMRRAVENRLTQIPAQLRAALLSEGATTGANALADARCIADPDERTSAILALLPKLGESERRDAIADCLAIVRSRGNQVQARFLPAIAACVADDKRKVLAAEALQAARSIGISAYRATGLGDVLPLLDEPLRTAAREEAIAALDESIMSASFREAASAVLPQVPARAPGLLASIRAIDDPFLRSMAFEAVVPHLPEAQRPAAAREGIRYFEESGANGLWILISLARHVPGFDLNHLVQQAISQDARQVPALLSALPQMLSGDVLQGALTTIATAAADFEEPSRTTTRIRLLAHYDAPQQAMEIDALLRHIPSLSYASWRRDAYIDLIAQTPRDRLPELKARLARIEDSGPVFKNAAKLSVYGSEQLRQELFARVESMEPSRDKFIALVALAQKQEDVQHPAILEAAYALIDYLPGWQLMAEPAKALAPLLTDAARDYLLASACDAVLRFRGFLAEQEFNKLAPALPDTYLEKGYRLLLEDSEQLSQHQQKYWADGPKVSDNAQAVAETLARIASHLPDSLLPVALAMARRMKPERWRWAALCHLLPQLSGAEQAVVRQEVVAGATNASLFGASEELQRFSTAACRALGHAIAALEQGADRNALHTRLLQLLHSIDPGWIPGLMQGVMPALSAIENKQLATRALATPNLFTALAVSRVIPEPERWSLLIAGLKKIVADHTGSNVDVDQLSGTVAALLEAPIEHRQQAWLDACGELRGQRAVVATYLAILAPLGASTDNEAILGAAARALLDVQAWWP